MNRALAPVLAALVLRLLLVLLCDRVVADVLRYHKLASHLLDVSWNPYQAPRLYPYPPVWMFWEAASLGLERLLGLPFAVVVKLPVVAADVAVVELLRRAAGARAAWIYALHPVALLIAAVHGQFDALALLAAMAAVLALGAGRADRSALWLALAIALKSFPVLLLPFFALHAAQACGGWRTAAGLRAAARYGALATLPVAAALVPFLFHDASAVRRELFGYGGIADFGWIGAWRGLRQLATGALARSEAALWPDAVTAGKALFLLGLAALAVTALRRPAAWPPARAAFVILLGFLGLYGAISAQYLLWPLPFALLIGERSRAWDLAAALALCGFYLFLAPGTLLPARLPEPWHALAGRAWALGAAATWLAGLAWLWRSLRSGSSAEAS